MATGKKSSTGFLIGSFLGVALLGGAIWGLAHLEKEGAKTPPKLPETQRDASPDGAIGSLPQTTSEADAAGTADASGATASGGEASDASMQDASFDASSDGGPSTDATFAEVDASAAASAPPATSAAPPVAVAALGEPRLGAPTSASAPIEVHAELETVAPSKGIARGEKPGRATKEAIALADDVCAASASAVARCAGGGGAPLPATVLSVHALSKDGYAAREARVERPLAPGAKSNAQVSPATIAIDACMSQELLKALSERIDRTPNTLEGLEGRAFFRCSFPGGSPLARP